MPGYLTAHGLARSSSEARRLIAQGGVRLNGERLGEGELDVPRGRLAGAELRVGRRFSVIDAA
jgi:ribosomal protein S4